METGQSEPVGGRPVRLILKAAAILLIGSGGGLAYNALSDAGIPLRTPVHPSLSDRINWDLYREGLRVSLPQAKQAFDRKDVVFIDARSPAAYAAGHIPGALNLPVAEFEARGRELLADLPEDARIITYCSGGGCQNSITLAGLLIQRFGYTRTRVFYRGWDEWFWAGYPIARGDAP